MDIKELESHVRRDFNHAMCIVGLSNTWIFVYLLVGRSGSFEILKGPSAYIILATMSFLLLGLVISRKIAWSIIERLVDFNHKIARLHGELIEKKRFAAVTETALALSHEINNPLMIIRGNLSVLETEIKDVHISDSIINRFNDIKHHCERIRRITDKLSNLSKPVSTTIYGESKMIDIEKS